MSSRVYGSKVKLHSGLCRHQNVTFFSVFSGGLASQEGAEITGERCSTELDSGLNLDIPGDWREGLVGEQQQCRHDTRGELKLSDLKFSSGKGKTTCNACHEYLGNFLVSLQINYKRRKGNIQFGSLNFLCKNCVITKLIASSQ